MATKTRTWGDAFFGDLLGINPNPAPPKKVKKTKDASRVGPLATMPNVSVTNTDYVGQNANVDSQYPISAVNKVNKEVVKASAPAQPSKTTRVSGYNRAAGGMGIAAVPTNDKVGFARGSAERGGGWGTKANEKYWYGSTTSDFGPRVSEAAKLERLRASRAALSKTPAAAAPIPKAKPKVTVKAAAAPAPKAKPVAKKAVKPALPSTTGKVTGKSVTLQQKKFKSAYARRMADRYSIGPNGKPM